MKDPYPGKSMDQVLQALKKRFPAGDINHHPNRSEVFVSLPLTSGGDFRARLTWQEAKYVAFGQVTGDDLKNGNFPKDWPT